MLVKGVQWTSDVTPLQTLVLKYSRIKDYSASLYFLDSAHIEWLVQERRNSFANALELRLFALIHRYNIRFARNLQLEYQLDVKNLFLYYTVGD